MTRLRKLQTLPTLLKSLQKLRRQGRKLVFTNGCFDILHVGHVRYLQAAQALGDVLILGLNSDASVRKLKGADRPVTRQKDRAEILAALACVDFICLFGDPTPLRLIKKIRPDFLVKGGDWKPAKIVGNDVVKSYGGRVLSIPFQKGYSTTATLQKIRHL